MADYLVPLLILTVSLAALYRKESTYDLLLEGGTEGLQLVTHILPLEELDQGIALMKSGEGMEIIMEIGK